MKAVRLYAQVLVDVVMAPNSGFKLEQLTAELGAFHQTTSADATYAKVFANPALGDDEKQKALSELAQKSGLSPLAARFLSLLARRNRLDVLGDVLKAVEALEIEKNGGVMGELVSAVPLESGVVIGIQEALSKRLSKTVSLKQKVDPGLIAGMRVTISGVTYDGSVRGKLNKLAENVNH